MKLVVETVYNRLVKPLSKAGFELADVEWLHEDSNWILRVSVEKLEQLDDEMNVKHCVEANRVINPILDEIDSISTPYTLEVSTPGIFRRLSKPKHFKRFEGEWINLEFSVPLKEVKKMRAQLQETKNNAIVVLGENQNTPFEVAFDQIAHARLDPNL